MPKVDSVVLLNDWIAAGDRKPLATPVAIGSGSFLSSGVEVLTPSPTSPRRYQPLNSSAAGGGRPGAGGKSGAPAGRADAPVKQPATARALNSAMTTIPSFGAKQRRSRILSVREDLPSLA